MSSHQKLAREILAREEKQRRHRLIQRTLIVIGGLCASVAAGYALALVIAS